MALFKEAPALIVLLSALSVATVFANSTTTASDEKMTGVCAETNPGDKKITLECPPGTIIKKMKAAAWGQNPGECPSVRRHSKCTLDITDFMERYCIQSNKCPVTVTKEILGYPVDKNGQECLPDETPFTFVASFYCGIAGWNDVAPSRAAAGNAMGDMPMDTNNETTPAPESASKPQRSSAMSATSSVAAALAAVLLVLIA